MEKDFFNLDKILNSDKLFTYEVKNLKLINILEVMKYGRSI